MAEFNIDRDFSVYKLISRKESVGAVISHRQTMSAISHLIEETIRTDHANNVIFSAFQYISKFKPQMKRYREIAKIARHVYIFAVMDEPMPEIPNLTYVPLEPDFQLTKEWFIVSYGEHFSTALATEELSDFHDPDDQRRFRGMWLVNDPLVKVMYDWLERTAGQRVEQQSVLNTTSDLHKKLMVEMKKRFHNYIDNSSKPDLVRSELTEFSPILTG